MSNRKFGSRIKNGADLPVPPNTSLARQMKRTTSMASGRSRAPRANESARSSRESSRKWWTKRRSTCNRLHPGRILKQSDSRRLWRMSNQSGRVAIRERKSDKLIGVIDVPNDLFALISLANLLHFSLSIRLLVLGRSPAPFKEGRQPTDASVSVFLLFFQFAFPAKK